MDPDWKLCSQWTIFYTFLLIPGNYIFHPSIPALSPTKLKRIKDHVVSHYDLHPYNFKPGDLPLTWDKTQQEQWKEERSYYHNVSVFYEETFFCFIVLCEILHYKWCFRKCYLWSSEYLRGKEIQCILHQNAFTSTGLQRKS